ncbi:hypothetical protein NL676_012677 [Syzygium grande]|nr:hypothetical protein NL676_012677 [Syzygium grande]
MTPLRQIFKLQLSQASNHKIRPTQPFANEASWHLATINEACQRRTTLNKGLPMSPDPWQSCTGVPRPPPQSFATTIDHNILSVSVQG